MSRIDWDKRLKPVGHLDFERNINWDYFITKIIEWQSARVEIKIMIPLQSQTRKVFINGVETENWYNTWPAYYEHIGKDILFAANYAGGNYKQSNKDAFPCININTQVFTLNVLNDMFGGRRKLFKEKAVSYGAESDISLPNSLTEQLKEKTSWDVKNIMPTNVINFINRYINRCHLFFVSHVTQTDTLEHIIIEFNPKHVIVLLTSSSHAYTHRWVHAHLGYLVKRKAYVTWHDDGVHVFELFHFDMHKYGRRPDRPARTMEQRLEMAVDFEKMKELFGFKGDISDHYDYFMPTPITRSHLTGSKFS